jgi:AsmA protein
MKKYLKITALVLGGIILLTSLVMAYFAATFNPNDYKPQVIQLVKEKYDRDLTIDGDISLSFWPKLGADLGKVAISEHASNNQFASINSAKVALAVMPLLKKSLVVDTIYIDGAKANIVKYKDGTTNYDDFLSKDESESSEIEFNVQGINVTNSEVNYVDEAKEATYNISQFNLTSSHIALGEPIDLDTNFMIKANQPAIAANTAIKGNFLYDPDSKRFVVKGLDSSMQGEMLDGKDVDITATGDIDAQTESMEFLINDLKLAASGDFKGVKEAVNLSAPAVNIAKDTVNSKEITISLAQTKADGDLKLNMVLANMEGSPKAIQSSGITGDLSMVQGKRTVKGEFSSPFKGNIEALIFDIPKLVGKLDIKDPSLPNGAVKGTFNLSSHADIKKELANSTFNIVLEDTKLNGDVAVASFKQPNIKFNLNADKLDLNKLLGAPKPSSEPASKEPANLTALNTLLLDGKVNINSIVYDKQQISGLNLGVKADGKKVAINGLNVKVNNSQIKGALSVSQFAKPLYTFDLDINELDLNDYVNAEETSDTKTTGDEVIDLSALKALNANGSLRIGKLSYGETKLQNVRIDLKADGGVATLAPFSASLYGGNMQGSLNVDARATPNIAFKQSMSSVAVGPLLQDTINNDMLSGTGTVNIDIATQGNTVNTFKKNLAGNSSLALADGALKGIDIAGKIRDIKSKVNLLKGNAVETASDEKQKTDFSELNASFNIKNGIAHNEDLNMKAPILRLAKGDSFGDINIGNQTLNYTAAPTIVKSIKGQGGENLDELAGISIPLKISGTFSDPKFGLDTQAIVTGLAKSKLLEKVGGEKGAAVQELIGGDNKLDAIKGLLGKKKPADTASDAATTEPTTDGTTTEAAPAEKPETVEDKAKEKLKGILKF